MPRASAALVSMPSRPLEKHETIDRSISSSTKKVKTWRSEFVDGSGNDINPAVAYPGLKGWLSQYFHPSVLKPDWPAAWAPKDAPASEVPDSSKEIEP